MRPAELARVVVDQLSTLGADGCVVASLDPGAEELEIIISAGHSSRALQAQQRVPLSRANALGEVVHTGQPVFAEAVEELAARHAAIPGPGTIERELGYQAYVAIPLIAKGRVIGSMGLGFCQPRRFDDADRSFITAVASHCAQALERARAHEQERVVVDRLQRLQSMAAAVASSLTPDDVARAVIHQAHDALGAAISTIFACDEATGRVRLLAGRELSAVAIEEAGWLPEDSELPLAVAVRTGEGVWLEDRAQVLSNPALVRFDTRPELLQAAIALPLKVDQQIIGGMAFSFRQPQRFSQMDREYLEALARTAAQALERARLYERERRARAEAEAAHQRMRLLAEVSHTLAASRDSEHAFAAIARLAVSALADVCIILLEGQDGALAQAGLAHRDPAHEALLRDSRALQDELTGRLASAAASARDPGSVPVAVRVWRTGVPEVLADVGPDMGPDTGPDTGPGRAHALGLRSLLAVPLTLRDRTVGVLALGRGQDSARFTADDLPLAEELARRSALALDNLRLFRERDRQLTRMHALAEASRLFAELHLDVQVIAERLVKRVLMVLGDGCAVRLVSTDGQWLEPAAWDQAEPALREALRGMMARNMPVTEGLAGRIYQSGKGVLLPHLEWDLFVRELPPDQRPFAAGHRMASLVAAPMRAGSRVVGVVTVTRNLGSPEPFTEDDSILLQELADRAALAIAAAQEHNALELEKERYRTLVQATAQMVWATDVDGKVIEDSPSWRVFTGQSQAEYRGAGWLDAIHPEDRERAWATWLAAVATIHPFESEVRIRRHDGQYVHCHERAAPVLNDDDTVREWIWTAADISARKQAEESLVEANRRKDEFLAMLGHELRNPLAPIMTALHLMKLGDEAKAEKARAVIERQVLHVSRLVDDLLDVSRITRGKIDLKKEPVELSAMVGKAIEMASPLLEQRAHHLSVDVPRHGIMLQVDPTRFAQVLANLLTNAAKYTPPGGRIRIASVRRGDRVIITVKDSGIGFRTEVLPRLFEPFYQAERTVERAHGGLGLGLALVKNLVELHDGVVTAYSEGPGQGSEFAVELPTMPVQTVSEEPEAARPVGRRLVDPAARRRVLVVDDNPDAADTLADMLEQVGHQVVVAYDGPQALSLVREFAFDVALLDIGLPLMDGYELARRLRELAAGRPVRFLALTGYGQEEDRARSHAAGFVAHFTKPIRWEAIAAAVVGTAEQDRAWFGHGAQSG